ncbi:MAG TPA: ThuA domain-containing protein [Gemmataceae bacterium]|nr:ThuA domain-containing protein [Gemmataceae bacterium]
MRRSLFQITPVVLVMALLAVGGSTVSGQDDKMIEKVMKALPEKAPAQAKKARKILIYSRTAGFRHPSIAIGARAITLMGDKTGAYTAYHTEDESFFEPEKLKTFDAVFMLNTTGTCLKPKNGDKAREEELKKSLVDFVAGGKGLIGVHSATDTYQQWKDYNKMMGGAFVSHPWHKKVPVKNLAPDHPLNAAFGGKDFEITDEIYMFRNDTALPTERKMLLALDTEKMDMKDVSKGKRTDNQFAVSWVATYGKGRTFYCSLGHREEIFWNPAILRHYLAGIQYVLGDLPAEATPTPK